MKRLFTLLVLPVIVTGGFSFTFGLQGKWGVPGMNSFATIFLNTGLALCTFAVIGCTLLAKKISVRGQLSEYTIETTVDDESAKYYLENYLSGIKNDPGLNHRIDDLCRQLNGDLPSREDLKRISNDFSVDFATLVFANQLLKQNGNSDLQKRFLKNLERVRTGTMEYPRKDILIMFVPGYDYVASGSITGADFAKPIKLLKEAGYEVHFVAIDPLGSVEENALFLSRTLARHSHRKIALAGASSAGPAIHLTLGKLMKTDELQNVKAWLNLGGILQGAPVLDTFSRGPAGWLFSLVLWFKGWKRYSFESMYTPVSRERFTTLRVPQHILIYNYLGLSLSGDVSNFARDKYWIMKGEGPNDGLTLLPDIIAPNSQTILSPKTDHFFAQDPEIDSKTLALLITIMEGIK